ncbi:MAG TPA: MFS transporter [Casimicrobiaceae bacterium]|nr:MFS transporter [Casimicrobiaceae bacterium]
MHFDAGMDRGDTHAPVSRVYALIAFALLIGLMLSDYLSRQVINAVFPFLKAEWALTDAQLGSLASVVALVVGVMTFPVSLLADRWGRVRSATAMALVWGTATVACGLAGSFASMFAARAAVGLGEAGYGSAGGAILTHLFPRRLHATVMGAFLAAALFGSVLGVVLGGVIAKSLGWQMAFITIGAGGLVLAIVFPLVVKEPPSSTAPGTRAMPLLDVIRELFRFRSVNCTYVASGLSMFIQGAVIAWAPSFMNRYYGLDPAQSAVRAGALVLMAGVGMTIGGIVADRLSARRPSNRLLVPALYALVSGSVLFAAFSIAPGTAQFVLVALGLLIGAGFAGPSGAVAADVTNPAIRATVFATLTLANNLIGLAPGPFVTGMLADAVGLDVALRIIPAAGILAAVFYFVATRSYDADRARYALPATPAVSAACATGDTR